MARTSAALLALATLLLLSPQRAMSGVAVPCESLTRVDFCTECARPAGSAATLCYLCHPTRASTWRTDGSGTITQCKAPTTGATCTKASGDPNCAYCDGIYCIKCNFGFEFNSQYKCQRMNYKVVTGCGVLSKNSQCGACTSDGACTLCANPSHILVPLNAIYINAAGQGSQCMDLAKLKTEALAITGKPLALPAGCREVDTEFKCARCNNGYSLTGGKCVRNGNKCVATLPFWHYCAQCDATGRKCVLCNGSRSPLYKSADGSCALPCKQLFGIGCLKCHQLRCLAKDTKYSAGRR
ncbi:serine threonine [Chlorella sorokiniana]|uniref:Serine threonine n=1 Tax=Chlorella sorokiniana TaxID=3076 RepID=A0A2P6U5D9_CHLSO|nr:serine threonine [Chlorella sorokiniana]|eukprot:PRW61533.1 serine threonine [Chlorella sorokiniana]